MKLTPFRRRQHCTVLAFFASTIVAPLALHGQSDNFDSGSLNPLWQKLQFFGQSYTFPANGSGKALRIQAAPVPNAAPAAAAIVRTNQYTDFYVSVDVVNWAVKNQAVVLFGRMTPGGAAGLAESTSMILNYDVQQDGDGAGDRKGGELQINVVSPGFATLTLAAAEVTFEPGQSYRLVFKGQGTFYTGQAYDLNDLTKPLAEFYADDPTYAAGLCGLLSFSRDGTTGTTDVTFDNYFAGASDPNLATPPALSHPIAGTPVVSARTPAGRFQNFHPAASGISFTANTYTANQINASATKLFLNGVDVSASLAPFPANGSTASFTTAGGTLAANSIYEARIELQDVSGTQKSTHTFSFDTFSDAFVSTAPVKTIEAEDYNFNSGQWQPDPIAVSGIDTNGTTVNGSGVGYYDLPGTTDVDYSKPAGSYHAEFSEYRTSDRVQITQGSYTAPGRDEAGDTIDLVSNVPPMRVNDSQRAKYVATNVWEYQVRLTSPGDWMNYTRSFTPTNYNVYLRCATFGSTTVDLERVTSDPTVAGQSTARLGSFYIGNHVRRLNYKYVPLMSGPEPVVVSLSGTNTLRLTQRGTLVKDERVVVMDYLLFVPTTNSPTTVFDTFSDGNDTVAPQWDHFDPIGGLTAPPAIFLVTNGTYRIISPAQLAPGCDAGPSRAGSFIHGANYTDFFVSVDILDFDDTVRQAFGIVARVTTPGLGTTGGYLFSWEPGSGSLPGTSNGDLDISRLVGETPVGQIETNSSGLHLERGHSYRFVFMGSGPAFEAQVYELPNISEPLIRLGAFDPDDLYPSGQVGLISASQSSCTIGGDATFDNFFASPHEPRLTATKVGNNLVLSWPTGPSRLQTSPSVTPPVWTEIPFGSIVLSGGNYTYTVPASGGPNYYRLVYP